MAKSKEELGTAVVLFEVAAEGMTRVIDSLIKYALANVDNLDEVKVAHDLLVRLSACATSLAVVSAQAAFPADWQESIKVALEAGRILYSKDEKPEDSIN